MPIAAAGTALTANHLRLIGDLAGLAGRPVLAAFDNDPAGRNAGVRAYQLLRSHGVDQPLLLNLPAGADPAQLLVDRGPAAVTAAINTTTPLFDLVVDTELARHLPAGAPGSSSEAAFANGLAMRRTVERLLAPDGHLVDGATLARQATRLAAATNLPLGNVIDAIGASAYWSDWAGALGAAPEAEQAWLATVAVSPAAAFLPYLAGDMPAPAEVDAVLEQFRWDDPHAHATADQPEQQLVADLGEHYRATLTDYLALTDSYRAGHAPLYQHIPTALQASATELGQLHEHLVELQQRPAAAYTAQHSSDPAAEAAAADQVRQALASLQELPNGEGATALAAYADEATRTQLTRPPPATHRRPTRHRHRRGRRRP